MKSDNMKICQHSSKAFWQRQSTELPEGLEKKHAALLRPHSLATASQSHREAVASQDLAGFLFPAKKYAGERD